MLNSWAVFFNEQRGVVAAYRFLVSLPASILIRIGIGPTALNIVGLLSGLSGAGCIIIYGNFGVALWLVLIAGLADALDGAVARGKGIASQFGNFLDSVLDRYVDSALLLSLFWYFAFHGQQLSAFLTLMTILGTTVTSYAKARGEALGVHGRYVGVMNRPERIILLLIGLAFPNSLFVILWVLAIFTNLTAIQRIIFYLVQLQRISVTNEQDELELSPLKEDIKR